VIGCNDLVRPDPFVAGGSPLFAEAPVASEQGCARFTVQLHGRDSIIVDSVTATGPQVCGAVRPVLVGKPVYDRTRRVIQLPIALENSGQQQLRDPARLYGWEDSVTIVAPAGLVGNEYAGYIDFVSSDSSIAATATSFNGALVWRLDTLLAATAAEPQRLAPGARSRVRWVELTALPGVQEFTATFWAAARRVGLLVPAAAPDTIPAWVHADSNLVNDTTQSLGVFYANVIFVEFEEGTSQAARQEAIDAVGGEVIGGRMYPSGGEGLYFVRIDAGRQAAPLLAAIRRLRTLSQIVLASFDAPTTPKSRKPWDGNGYQQWTVDRNNLDASGSGMNWGLEDINAPLAWGCSVGDAQTTIAVVDYGFHRVGDINANVSPAHEAPARFGTSPADTAHGTHVAAVLAARGDDSTGITGAMWRADLRLHAYRLVSEAGGAIEAAAIGGARVINLSTGYTFPRQPRYAVPESLEVDSLVRVIQTGVVRRVLTRLARRQLPLRPLIVEAAGNGARDAFWDAYGPSIDHPEIRQGGLQLRGQFLVVTAAARRTAAGRQLWDLSATQASDTGASVDLAAPGDAIGTLHTGGAVILAGGTSVATPLVTGIAGLLLSFDPALGPADVRALILAGAQAAADTVRNPRQPSGRRYLLANAYEALKQAARRPGAPLCGNRMWTTANDVFAQRAAGGERLFGGLDFMPWTFTVHHGGRRLDFETGRVFQWENRTWTEVADPSTLPLGSPSGTGNSQRGMSHNADTLAGAGPDFATGTTSSSTMVVRLADAINGEWSQMLATTQILPARVQYLQPSCPRQGATFGLDNPDDPNSPVVFKGYQCLIITDSLVSERVENDFVTTYSPTGDRAIVALTRIVTSIVGSNTQGCFDSSGGTFPDRCVVFFLRRRPEVTQLWSVAIPSGAITELPSIHGAAVGRMGMSEDGRELTVSQHAWTETWLQHWAYTPTPFPKYNFAHTVTECSVHFRDVRTAGDIIPAMATPARCGGHMPGGFSPVRTPVASLPSLPSRAAPRRETRSRPAPVRQK
jgi:subtilisin family serine protease